MLYFTIEEAEDYWPWGVQGVSGNQYGCLPKLAIISHYSRISSLSSW